MEKPGAWSDLYFGSITLDGPNGGDTGSREEEESRGR